MFKAATSILLLALAGAPSASLYCKAWCLSHEGTTSTCHHEGTAPASSVQGDETCEDAALQIRATLREADHGASYSDADSVVLLPRSLRSERETQLRAAWTFRQVPSDLNRPLATPLRI